MVKIVSNVVAIMEALRDRMKSDLFDSTDAVPTVVQRNKRVQ